METAGIATQGEFVFRLRQVYVDVSLRPETPQNTAAAPFLGQAAIRTGERRSLVSFLKQGDESKVFAVIGGPGSGKTTLMRATAGDLCRERWRHRTLPVLLYLRDHATVITESPYLGIAEIAGMAAWVSGRIPSSWIARRLERGGCLIMLDGLDEVAGQEERTAVVSWVRQQIERYPDNDFLVTSRPHGYLSNPLAKAEVLQVRRFTGEQISRFLHAWYYAIECRSTATTGKQPQAAAQVKAEDLLQLLRARPGLYDLAANPLLLTMIANVHRYRGALPGSRAELYAEMCQVLVHRRQESKGLTDTTGLSGPQKEHIARVLAWSMMTTKIRDIPALEARQAIAPVLRQVSRKTAPSAFLDEAKKSGLLIEHEHDCHAFAHLTLQEYLAAAHISETSQIARLTFAVDDPWWRETILLWAANADASPVIRACLASGTVRALALAFDCADEALKVDPDISQALEGMLAAPESGTEFSRDRLIHGVKAARSLREIVWLSDDTAMCANPVPQSLYALFVRYEQTKGRHISIFDGGQTTESTDTDAPAIGLWASDTARFVAWLNDLFDDDTTYRLPTSSELADTGVGMVTDLTRHTIWAGDNLRPQLHKPDIAPWPWTLDPELLRTCLISDRIELVPYLRLILTAALDQEDARVLAYSYVLAGALTRRRSASDLHILNLLRAHTLAHALALTLALSPALDFDTFSEHEGDAALARVRALHLALDDDGDIALRRDFALALARDIELANILGLAKKDLGREINRALGHGGDITLVQDLANDRRLSTALARDLAHGLSVLLVRRYDPDPDPDLDLARQCALNLAFDYDSNHAPILDHDSARDLIRALDLALARALDRALDHDHGFALARHVGHDLAAGLAQALGEDRSPDRTSERALDRALDRNLKHTRDLAGDLASAPDLTLAVATEVGLDLVHDPAFDIARVQTCTNVLGRLLNSWAAVRNRKYKAGAILEDFDAFLTGALPKVAMPIPHDPAVPLQQARHLLSETSIHHQVTDQLALQEARSLLDDVQKMIVPILDRTAGYDRPTLACASLALLAATMLLNKAQARQATDLVFSTLLSLAVLQEMNDGRLLPNDILLLVRS